MQDPGLDLTDHVTHAVAVIMETCSSSRHLAARAASSGVGWGLGVETKIKVESVGGCLGEGFCNGGGGEQLMEVCSTDLH